MRKEILWISLKHVFLKNKNKVSLTNWKGNDKEKGGSGGGG